MKRLQFVALITLMFALVAGSDAADKIVADFGGLGAFQSTTWVAKDLQIVDKGCGCRWCRLPFRVCLS